MRLKIKRKSMIVVILFAILGVLWAVLTLIAQREREAAPVYIGREANSRKRALMIYNPDLFYNLDQKVCTAMAHGLAAQGWKCRVLTVADAKKVQDTSFALYVFCANTYNWAPDRPISRFIRDCSYLRGKATVAITLGSGSTQRSKHLMEQMLREKGVRIIASKTYWLMRPNEEGDTGTSNVALAEEKARNLGFAIGRDWR